MEGKPTQQPRVTQALVSTPETGRQEGGVGEEQAGEVNGETHWAIQGSSKKGFI